MGTALLIVGLLAGLAGLLLTLTSRSAARKALAAPVYRIADAPRSGEVTFEGKVVAAAEGTLEAPYGGAVVWFSIKSEQADPQRHTAQVLEVVQQSVPFDIDDGSGERARVLPDGAHIVTGRFGVRTTRAGGGQRLQAFLNAHMRERQACDECVTFTHDKLEPGEVVVVRGTLRPDTQPDTQYRTGAHQRTLAGSSAAKQPLLVMVGTAAQLAANVKGQVRFALAALVMGVALAAAGVALR